MVHMERDATVTVEDTQRPPIPRPLKGLDPDILSAIRQSGHTLRRGLPGDGTPQTAKEARQRCPHIVLRSKLNPGYRPNTLVVVTWRERPEQHQCVGGWEL